MGAHADVLLYYHADGATIGQMPLDTYLDPCRVIRYVGAARVEPEHMHDALTNVPPRVLLRTCAQMSQTAWDADSTAVTPGTIALMAVHDVKFIGVDTASLDL